jgi:di/tricarboxylate transporter
MTPAMLLLLAILGVALVLFSLDWVPTDVVALSALAALIIAGLLPAERAFAGFGSDTVIVILGLFILTAALQRTGVVEIAGRLLLRRSGAASGRLPALLMAAAASLSAFISNTAATAFLLPVAVGVAARIRIGLSRLLLPLAFAAILSSSVTLVSTSTNILVSGLMTQAGLAPIRMFELAPVGIPIALVGLAYMLLVGRRLIPERAAAGGLTESFGLRPYLTEVLIRDDSPLVGKTLAESGLGRDLDLTVVQVVRDRVRYLAPRAEMRLRPADVLLVEGERGEILKVRDTAGIDIKPDVELADPDVQSQEVRLVEAILLPGSPLAGRTLKGVGFRERYGLQVLGINRHGATIRQKISQVRLRMGDLLLLQGPVTNIMPLLDDHTLRILGRVEERRPNLRRAPAAVLIFVGVLAAATAGVPLPLAVLLGVVLAFVTRCITPEEAYREVDWKVVVLIACMLAVGAAMEHTGTARYLAGWIAEHFAAAGPAALLTGFFGLTVALTQPMSNQAAAAVVLPVALQAATHLGLSPRPFAMMIAIAASASYMTPLEPACLMVYGPGRYRFSDFLRVGALLTVLVYLVAILLVPRLWPF